MAILLTLLGMLGWQAVGAAPAGEVLFLDLTETMPSTGTPLTKFRTFGYVVESHPSPKPGWPIRVTILDAIDDPQLQDHVIVEMRIEALETVTLPRGRDRAVVDPEPEKPLPSLREMHFRLKLDGSAPGYGTTTPSQYLTGSSVVPDSLITLQPGQSIRVMLRQALGDTKRLARPGTPLLYRALVHTYEGSRSVSDVISDNTIGLNGR